MKNNITKDNKKKEKKADSKKRISKKQNKSKKQVQADKKNNIVEYMHKLFDKINWTKVLKYFLVLVVVLICFYVFMKFTLLITYDGSKYYSYLDHFKGNKSIGEWDAIRGFSFPLILFIITSIFGDSIRGVLIGFFIFYIGMLYFAAKIIKILISDNGLDKRQASYWIMFICLFLFNPLIIGYGHTLLTEAVIPFFYMLYVYLCLKWNNYSLQNNKKRFILISILLIILGVFVWFIKQPYAPTLWTAIFLISILSGICHRKFRYFFEKFIVLILCIVFTVISIYSWNLLLSSNNDKPKVSNSSFLANGLVGFTYHYNPIDRSQFCNVDYIKNADISKKEKSTIYKLMKQKKNWCDYLKFYNVIDLDKKIIDTEVIIQKSESISVNESLSFLLKSLTKHPILVLHSYYESYLSIIDLQKTKLGTGYVSEGELSANVVHENVGIGYVVFTEGYRNCWWLWQDKSELPPELLELTDNMGNYESTTNTGSNWSVIMQILQDGSELSFKILLLICLPLFIYSFLRFVFQRNNLTYLTITMLCGMSFVHIMFHVFMSALIDRYCYPVYPLMLLCLILLFMDKTKKYKFVDGSDQNEN